MATRKLTNEMVNAQAIPLQKTINQMAEQTMQGNLFQEKQLKPVATDYMNSQVQQGMGTGVLFNANAIEQNIGHFIQQDNFDTGVLFNAGTVEHGIGHFAQHTVEQTGELWTPIRNVNTETQRHMVLNNNELWNTTTRRIEREFNVDNFQNIAFEHQARELNAEITRIDAQLNIINTNLTKKKTQLEESRKELEIKEQQLKDAKEKLLQEEQKLQDIQNDITAKNKEKQDIQNKLEEKQNDLIIKFGQERNEALKKAQQEYDPEKDGDYNDYLSKKLSEVVKDPSISLEIEELKNRLTGIDGELNTLNGRLATQQNIVDISTKNVENIQSEVNTFKSTVLGLETEVSTLENNAAALKTEQEAQNTAHRNTWGNNINLEEMQETLRSRDLTTNTTARNVELPNLNLNTRNAAAERVTERKITPDVERWRLK